MICEPKRVDGNGARVIEVRRDASNRRLAPFLWLLLFTLMDINDLHPPDDYSHRFFIWHEWIQVRAFAIVFSFSMLIYSDVGNRQTDPSTQKMCLSTLRLPCSTISRATIRSYACKLCILVCQSRTKLLN